MNDVSGITGIVRKVKGFVFITEVFKSQQDWKALCK